MTYVTDLRDPDSGLPVARVVYRMTGGCRATRNGPSEPAEIELVSITPESYELSEADSTVLARAACEMDRDEAESRDCEPDEV